MTGWRSYRSALVWIGFQAVWFVSALAAASGRSWPGPLSALIYIFTVLALDGWPRRTMVAAATSGALGFLVEGALSVSGMVRFGAHSPDGWPAPLWIVLLWVAFGLTLEPLRALLGSRWLSFSAVLGLVLGPLAYLAGERLGALTLGPPRMIAYLAIATAWCMALPLLLSVSRMSSTQSVKGPE